MLKKRISAFTLAVLLLLSSLPMVAFAEPTYALEIVVDAIGGDADGYIKAGDKVTATVSLEKAGWAQDSANTGLVAAGFNLQLEKGIFQGAVIKAGKILTDAGYDFGKNFDPASGQVSVTIECPDPEQDEQGNYIPINEISFSDARTALFTVELTVGTTLPKDKFDNVAMNIINGNSSFSFGDMVDLDATEVKPTFTSRADKAVKIDTLAPTVKLEGTEAAADSTQKYFYQPIAVLAEDGTSIASVTLDGQAVAGPQYTLTKGGKLVVTDRYGNSTSVTVQIDSAQFDATKAAIDKLPETVLYTTLADIKDAETKLALVTDATAKGKLDGAKLTQKRTAWNAIQAKVDEVVADIAALPKVVTPAHITQVEAIETKIAALKKDCGVADKDISNYATFTAAQAAIATAKKEKEAVTTRIAALPAKDKVMFSHQTEVNSIDQEVKKLQTKYGADFFSAADLTKLTDAQAALKNLADSRAKLVKDIADATLTVSLKKADTDAIAALRTQVKALEDKGTTFTAQELKKLKDAEDALTVLKNKSKAVHDAIAALTSPTNIKYTDAQVCKALREEMKGMEAEGDTFTEAELGKITACEAALADLDKRMKKVSQDMAALPETVNYTNRTAANTLQAEIAALKAKACPIDEANMGKEPYARYASFVKSLDAMNTAIAGLNQKMQAQLKEWSYNNLGAFEAIQKEIDEAIATYSVAQADVLTAFPEYKRHETLQTQAEALLKKINTDIDALPEKVTGEHKKEVTAIHDSVEILKAAPYRMAEAALKKEMTEARWTKYTNAWSIVAPKPAPQPPADNNQSAQDAPATTSVIAKTSDNFAVVLWILLAVMGAGGTVAVFAVRNQRKKNHF